MAMTEADAKTKWCPFSRVIPGVLRGGTMEAEPAGVPAHNRVQEPHCEAGTWHAANMCIASECMSWRWSRAKETKAYLDAVQAEMKASGTNFNSASNKVWTDTGSTFEQVEGYCGLAGKPE